MHLKEALRLILRVLEYSQSLCVPVILILAPVDMLVCRVLTARPSRISLWDPKNQSSSWERCLACACSADNRSGTLSDIPLRAENRRFGYAASSGKLDPKQSFE